jgi:hypothetical protein
MFGKTMQESRPPDQPPLFAPLPCREAPVNTLIQAPDNEGSPGKG